MPEHTLPRIPLDSAVTLLIEGDKPPSEEVMLEFRKAKSAFQEGK